MPIDSNLSRVGEVREVYDPNGIVPMNDLAAMPATRRTEPDVDDTVRWHPDGTVGTAHVLKLE
jgi:hypothetical protein